MPPGTNQVVVFGNDQPKTLVIDASTVATYPESLRITALTISAPDGDPNVLLVQSLPADVAFDAGILNLEANAILSNDNSAMIFGGAGVFRQYGGLFHITNKPGDAIEKAGSGQAADRKSSSQELAAGLNTSEAEPDVFALRDGSKVMVMFGALIVPSVLTPSVDPVI